VLTELEQRAIAEDEIDTILSEQEEKYEQREMAAAISVTFAGMCLEAFFYDYAAENLGDSYTQQHLDKLDLPSKLIVIPHLVTGRSVDKSGQGYEAVKHLSKDRNDLVHFKSRAFPLSELDKASDFHDELNKRLKTASENGVQAIELVMKELDELHSKNDYYFNRVCV
jgi:hypothetical protein